jgi:hypothetical protein
MKLRLTCREVTRLVLEGDERALGRLERLSLRLHWLACEACARFARQNATMRVAVDRWRAYRNE